MQFWVFASEFDWQPGLKLSRMGPIVFPALAVVLILLILTSPLYSYITI